MPIFYIAIYFSANYYSHTKCYILKISTTAQTNSSGNKFRNKNRKQTECSVEILNKIWNSS